MKVDLTPCLECPFCGSTEIAGFSRDKHRTFHRCEVCSLVFVPPSQHPSAGFERKRYDLHRNSPGDSGYCAFLRRLFVPLERRLARVSRGLDFGSGPSPTLALLFREAGHAVTLYDPFYALAPEALEGRYDFITATEVVEHLHSPRKELDRLWACLRPGGWLGIMTKPVVAPEKFATWYYKNDPTHVCFFAPETFHLLARAWNANVTFVESDVVLFQKK